MRYEFLSAPVEADQPAGPDLDEEMDNDYLNYTLVASGRLPERFFTDGQPFDRTTIALDDEMQVIDGLLARTRDARLLTLAARFNALAGNIMGFCEVVDGLAIIVTNFWDQFYPRESDGDFVIRQNVIEGLDDLVQVIFPLQYAPIASGPRLQTVTLRAYMLASNKAERREGEETPSLGSLINTLAHEMTREHLLGLHAALSRASAALNEIRQAFIDHDAGSFVPSFDRIAEVLRDIDNLIVENRPELASERRQAAAEEEAAGGDGAATGSGPAVLVGDIKTHGQARAALSGVERYFLTTEPSNPALILVHQARMLIGRPLTEALDALMPRPAERATVRFEAGFSFEINLSQMRTVTEHAFSDENDVSAIVAAPSRKSRAARPARGSSEPEDDVELDAWGQPIRPAPPQPQLDAWGQPIRPAPPQPQLDAWGQPIQPAPPGPELDAWGEPIVRQPSGPRYDAWGELIVDEPAPAAESPPEDIAPEPAAEPEAAETAAPPPEPEPEPEPEEAPADEIVLVESRNHAADLLQAVEGFFRQVEPSSSVPILLSKARSYLNRDFASILSELIPRLPDAN